MQQGFFRIAFTGVAGSGFGVTVLQNGAIAGADVAGGTFSGTYVEDLQSNKINFDITMHMPAGVTPVQTGIPLAAAQDIPITGSFLLADILSENPILLQTLIGPINIVFKKLSDL
ncbi:hypothetical protein [Acidisphaera sp. S103]|uniref:hypothetical protein n=1 Tax=Acidisphaera sp. S103 TaxID=1747223 RepID=UPI00131E9921|nr:hypothetical protein [Acidisphaera sp. S103]